MLTAAEPTAGAMLAVAASHNVASNNLRLGIDRYSLMQDVNSGHAGWRAAAAAPRNL
jgi:hypothetical protein